MQNKTDINNQIYNELGERWYTAFDDPVALLRQESKTKIPWVLERIRLFSDDFQNLKVLDVGCGAGFLSNRLAEEGLQVTGVDLSEESIAVAQKFDSTKSVRYLAADAYRLPFADASFDVITAMDFLEHVEKPAQVVQEIGRVLKPGGIFFFHTFNRNWLAHIVIIRMVELLVKNTPKNMHVIELFIKPEELVEFCRANQMQVQEMTGIRPLLSTVTAKGLFSRTVPENFRFTLTKSLKLSYLGYALKK